jgi:L-arabinose transport system ATP-binding protein
MTTDHVTDITFELRAGEVLGLGGLMGAGRSEIAKGLFGFHRRRAGRVVLDGQELPPATPARLLRQGWASRPKIASRKRCS